MTRSQATSWVDAKGGANASSVSKNLDYLVVGDDGSFLLGDGSKGDKVEAAERLIANGSALKIISETDFLMAVGAPKPEAPKKRRVKEGPKKESAPIEGGAFDPTGKKFLFTGKLLSMSRADANARVKSLGGICAGSVSNDLDYLVVGDSGSPLFGAGAKGEKILAAEKLVTKGAGVKIITESAFMEMKAASRTKVK
ncbi:MAG: BRCT domain-containing protein [Deltaproteobacteria bacterium]|nr:BRCT domain-containing protein [Deltaproteobacteria bacterium]